MSLVALKNNMAECKKIIKDLKKLDENLKYADVNEREFYFSVSSSLYQRLRIINSAIAEIVEKISSMKKLSGVSGEGYIPRADFVNLSYSSSGKEKSLVTLKKEDKEQFLKELSLSENNLQRYGVKKTNREIKKPSRVIIFANKIFGRFSERISFGRFSDLKSDLREANSSFLLVSYLSTAILVSLSVFFLSLFAVLVFSIFNLSAFLFIWVPFVLLLLVLFGFYLYPSLQKSSFEQGVGSELPFATIYMSAIAGSNIEPTKIFKIIADSPEYNYIGTEMRKVINQVEIYGFDLVTSLKNVAKSTPNKKLSELLNGMAINISSGSSLKSFLEKKAEALLSDYKLERTKYSSVAGTFMDVYISILITAPLILVLLIVIMSLTKLNLGGLSADSLVGLSIGAVAVLNLFFLLFLQIKQPKT